MRYYKSLALLLVAAVITTSVRAEEGPATDKGDVASIHELQALLELAKKREKIIRETIKDYTCLIVKRERIHGVLQDHRFIEARVRPVHSRGGTKVPLAVHLYFRRPNELAGRTIIYVEGQNDDKMLVRRGGDRLSYMTVDVDPESELARTETLMHIGHLGFDRMVSEIIDQIQADIESDPSNDNTELRISRNAHINNRPCTSIQITHPQRKSGLDYYRAEFFVDDEYHLPVRVAAYDWPTSEGDKPKLLAEFTYTNVKVNVGLTDADFDMEGLRTASR